MPLNCWKKQVSAEVEASEVGRKGTKLQDLESLFCSEGISPKLTDFTYGNGRLKLRLIKAYFQSI